uniref:Ig-like domain-containing protein n=1 Tax=Gallus gallus TaxID=9031 RepID=A0A8V0XJ88_CHICK
MAPMAMALILGWWLVAASRAQQVPRPSLSLHPSQGVSLGDTVTLRCHLPLPAAWVWLYLEGRWSYAKYIDKKQDTTEFSFLSASRDQAGTYLCQYQVSESEDVSVMSDPVKLVLTGAELVSRGNLVVAVVRGCAAALIFGLGVFFVIDARSLWIRRDESLGGDPLLYLLLYLQGPSRDTEDLTYTEMPAAIPCSQPPTSSTASQSPVIYTTVSTDLPR